MNRKDFFKTAVLFRLGNKAAVFACHYYTAGMVDNHDMGGWKYAFKGFIKMGELCVLHCILFSPFLSLSVNPEEIQ